jgi:hypothetical protein
MRTTQAEPASDRHGHDSTRDRPMLTRDNPRRHREPDDEVNDDDHTEDSSSELRSSSRS